VDFRKALFMSDEDLHRLQVMFVPAENGDFSFSVYACPLAQQSEALWTLHVTGVVAASDQHRGPFAAEQPSGIDDIQARCGEEIDGTTFYLKLNERMNQWGPSFQGIERIWLHDGEALGKIRVPSQIRSETDKYHIHPAVLDACIQVLGAVASRPGGNGAGFYLGKHVEEIHVFDRPKGDCLWSHVSLRPGSAHDSIQVGDVRILDEAGRLVLKADGVGLQQLDHKAIQEDWLYEIQWEEASRASDALKVRVRPIAPSPSEI